MTVKIHPPNGRSFRSNAQLARVVTEAWAHANLYCVACTCDSLNQERCNTPAVDFRCLRCGACYQLKGSKRWSTTRIRDAAYSAMLSAVRSDRVPNLLVMQYDFSSWQVHNLLIVPSFFFSESAVEKCPPLRASARRAGWVGCNIRLDAIAPEGKLPIIVNGNIADARLVRLQYSQVKPIAAVPPSVRGWTLDVLRAIHVLGRRQFSLPELYASALTTLSTLYPRNRNVKAKIRQQLQVLRDLGLLRFSGSGKYDLLTSL